MNSAIAATAALAATLAPGAPAWRHIIAEGHVGPITPNARFSVAAVQALFPGRPVRMVQRTVTDNAGDLRTMIEIGPLKRPLITLTGATFVRSVIVADPAFTTLHGRHPGQKWAATGLRPDECKPDYWMTPYQDRIVCEEAGHPKIRYFFSTPRFGNQGYPAHPTYTQAVLRQITWTP